MPVRFQRIDLSRLFALSLVGLASNVWSAGSNGISDRPSARIPERPTFLQEQKADFHLPPLPESLTPLISGEQQFHINQFRFNGNTVFDDAELQKLAVSYVGRTVRVDELEELRQQITHYYIDHGYINSGARILKNAVQNGVLTFTIVEGRLDAIKMHGQERLHESYIKSRLNDDAPLNITHLQERFQLLLTDPLIAGLKGRLLPGNGPSSSILDLEVTRARPYQVTLFTNNYRPPSIGAEAGGISSWVRNLTGFGDMLDFTFQGSGGSLRYGGGWSVPIFDYGTQAYFRFDEGDSSVIEAPTNAVDIKSQIHSLEGGFSHLLLNSLKRRLTFGVNLAVRQNETSLLGRPYSFIPGDTSGRSEVTVVRLYQEHVERMDSQVLALRSTFSVGNNSFGTSLQSDPHNPSHNFFAWLGQGQYAYRLTEQGAQVVLKGNVQLTHDSLLPLERIAVGGVNSVRGYRENQLVRDQGFSSSLEFHYPILDTAADANYSLTLIPFMDYGGAWDHAGTASYLHSTGLGLNWRYYQFNTEFYWARKIATAPIQQSGNLQDDGIHFQVKMDAF